MNAKNSLTSKLLALILTLLASLNLLAADKTNLPLPSSGNVTLTLTEYDRLTDLAGKAARQSEKPPVAYTIKHADLKLRVGTENVLGTVTEEGEVFSKSAAKVPLTSGLTILNARQQGKMLPLLQEGSVATAVLPGQSEFAVTLDAGMPLAIEAGRASFDLPVPAAGSVRMSLAIPGDHTNVRINPGLITARSSENGMTMVEATLAPGQPATVWWTTREVTAPAIPKEVRFLSDVKTLVSVGEADLRVAALADVTIVQGDPTQFTVNVPAGYEVTAASGATVESADIHTGELVLTLSSGAQHNQQFLISMERPLTDTKAEAPFLTFKDTQRETGEVLVESAGAMELTAKEGGGLKRMDLKEVNPYLRSLSRYPMQAGFRFHRQPDETPSLTLDWVRFPDSTVLAAVAEHAVVTTIVTSEGRSLTEVKLTVKNQAQPFLKLDLPSDANILSAEVAGEKVKPVQGSDGARVPLLRPGFRPTGAYEVSFVFLHSGAPFAKKGGSELSLPSMDVPISVLEWEVYLPERYKVKDFRGDAISESFFPLASLANNGQAAVANTYSGTVLSSFAGVQDKEGLDSLALLVPGVVNGEAIGGPVNLRLLPGQLSGVVTDPQGAVVSGAHVKVTSTVSGAARTGTSDSSGRWTVSGLPAGQIKVEVSANGFRTTVAHNTIRDAARSYEFPELRLSVAGASQTIEVTAAAPMIETTQSQVTNTFSNFNGSFGGNAGGTINTKKKQEAQQQASANVFNLQKKVAGVLPVRVDVPRAGASYRFARALVLDEETKLTFNYKTK
ncbi:MAG TPA: carboxypeptidase-like regulatory domain-containing protein [Candidatus Angelobacter sp.]|nr:carboxypeptidase-like regulatory domain-containing protein [Candidatus Angelobacter sp.]